MISIHALRVEGDVESCFIATRHWISIHALRVEGDQEFFTAYEKAHAEISIHALRVEGDVSASATCGHLVQFLSTPSGWRATNSCFSRSSKKQISIHALRVEGDASGAYYDATQKTFLSTPSGWRATIKMPGCIDLPGEFLSTPSGWRATYRSLSASPSI